MKADADYGIRFFQGERRDVMFVDEHPDLIDMIECRGQDVQRLHDELHEVNSKHAWAPALATVVSSMNKLSNSNGQTFTPSPLLTSGDAEVFADTSSDDLMCLSDSTDSPAKRALDAKALQQSQIFPE